MFKKIRINNSCIMFLSIFSIVMQGMQNYPATRGAKRKLAQLEVIKGLTPEQATQQLQLFIKKNRILPANPHTLEELNALIAQGADVNTRVNRGTPALMRAAASGNIDAMRALIAAGADVAAQRNSVIDSPVFCTISYNNPAALKLLIDSHAPLASALGCAVRHRNRPDNRVVQTLLDAGADPKKEDYFGMSPADFVLVQSITNPSYKQTWQLFTQKYPGLQLTPEQATQELQNWMDDVEKCPHVNHTRQMHLNIKKWIAFGADVKTLRSKNRGIPVLACASMSRNSESYAIVSELLAAGADINAQTEIHKITALMLAVHTRNQYLVELLLERGAKTNLYMQNGKTVVDIANFAGMPQPIKEMIDAHVTTKT